MTNLENHLSDRVRDLRRDLSDSALLAADDAVLAYANEGALYALASAGGPEAVRDHITTNYRRMRARLMSLDVPEALADPIRYARACYAPEVCEYVIAGVLHAWCDGDEYTFNL